MRFFRILQILVAGILITNLTACGFTPVYGTNSQSAQTLSNIQIAPPNTRNEYLFVSKLEERLGRNPNAGIRLKYNIHIFSEGLEVFGASRAQRVGIVRYRLISLDDDKLLAKSSVRNFVGYDPGNSFYEGAKRDATERLIQTLVDKTVTDIIIKLQAN